MNVREILDELPRLDVEARRAVFRRLVEMDPELEAEETADTLAAIDAGIHSLDAGAGVDIEEARRRVAQWTSK